MVLYFQSLSWPKEAIKILFAYINHLIKAKYFTRFQYENNPKVCYCGVEYHSHREKWELNYQKNSTIWNEIRFCWTEKQHLRKYNKGLTYENLYLPEIEKDKLLRFSCSRFFLYFVDCPALHFVHQIFVRCQAEEEKLTSIVKNFCRKSKNILDWKYGSKSIKLVELLHFDILRFPKDMKKLLKYLQAK